MRPLSPVRAIVYGTLIVGVLDILDAFVFFGVRNGTAPVRILQSIAAGLQGRAAAVAGGVSSAMLGLVLHFFNAFCIFTVYFVASRRLRVLTDRPVLCGILYGLVVYGVMNYVVVPLSAIGGGVRMPATPVLINGLLIHAFGVGLPCALVARAARPPGGAKAVGPGAMRRLILRHPVVAFYVLACAWTWPLAALIRVSLAFPLLGLFGPAAAAVVVTAITGGRPAVVALLRRVAVWRVPLVWYLVATLLPAGLAALAVAFNRVLGTPTLFVLGDFSAISLVLAVLVVGEEIGWRGYAMPALLTRHSPAAASLVVGLLWGLWHLPNFLIADYPHFGRSFLYFVAATVGYSLLFGWIYMHTKGSIFLATWFHAAINLFSPLGIPPVRADAIEAVLYDVAAGLVILIAGPGLRSRGKTEGFSLVS